MSILPATDILLDVSKAADPRRLAAGVQRLRAMSDTASNGSSTPTVRAARPAEFEHNALNEARIGAAVKSATSAVRMSPLDQREPNSQGAMAARKFEAFILQTWLETLLPKTEGGSFGTDGSAGVWRSMMAEQLGMQLARNGGIGLQKIIAMNQVGDDAVVAGAERHPVADKSSEV